MLWCNSGKPGTFQTLACVWSPAEVTRHSTKTGQLGGSWYKHYGLKTLEAETIKEKTWGAIKFFETEKTFAVICDFGQIVWGVCVWGWGVLNIWWGGGGCHKKYCLFHAACCEGMREKDQGHQAKKQRDRRSGVPPAARLQPVQAAVCAESLGNFLKL